MSNKCGCNIIGFGHINLYMLLIPLGAFFSAAKDIIVTRSEKLGKDDPKEPEKQHPVIITINYAFGLCLSFIFFIIYKICNKRHKNTNIYLLDKMLNKANSSGKISKKEKILWILLGSILDFFAKLIFSYNWVKKDDYLCYWQSNILLMSLFSYLLLKTKLYKHHYLSIILLVVFGITHNFIADHFTVVSLKENYIGHIINFFAEGIFNILYVLYKFFMIKKFIKSYEILFFQGLIESIIGIIMLTITTKYYPKLDSFNMYIENIEGKEIFVFISLIFINFVTFVTIFIIIDIFTPFHIFLLNNLAEIIFGFFDGTYKIEIYLKIIYYIFIIISIIIVLVFIEIIQLNFCGLSTMTKKNIEERARLDTIITDENDDEESNYIIKDTGEQKINIDDYTFELKELNIDEPNQILH